MAKYRKLTEKERAEIGALAKLDPNISALARKYQCTCKTIRRWLEEGKKRHPNYKNRRGQGRPRIQTANQQAKSRQKLASGESIQELHARLRPTSGRIPSTRTLVRTAKRGRDPLYYAPVARGSVLSDANIEARLRFCNTNPGLDPKRCVFLDAKYLYLYCDNKRNTRFCWQRVGDRPARLPSGTPTVFLFYGAVAHGQKSKMIFVPPTPPLHSNKRRDTENFNSTHFVHMMGELKEELKQWFPDGQYHILRDHAKQHTSKFSTEQMQLMELPIKSDYPAKSWDLNVIEKVWGILDGKLQGKKGGSNDAWRAHIEKAWKKVTQPSIDKLVVSLPARMAKLVENEGLWPKPSMEV